MHKKIFGAIFILVGVLVLMSAGCVKNGPVSPTTTPNTGTGTLQGGGEEEEKTDLYGSAEEISPSNALASELKTIFGEACGGVKLTEEFLPTSVTGHMLVYVWKNKPTAEKLENAFKKNGYEIEIGGEALIVKKGNIVLGISWVEEMDSQEIGVGITKEE